MIILFVLIGIVSGSSVHTDCYNHGYLVNGRCDCNVGYTGNNCELCDRCTKQGTCHGFLKALSSADDNDSSDPSKECVCVKDANGRPKYADIDCSKTPTCFNDNDCFKTRYSTGPLCINNLCDCSNAGGWTKGNDETDKCWYEPACLQCNDATRGECVYSHTFTGSYYKVSETCNCKEGYYGDNCEFDLVDRCNNNGYTRDLITCICVEGKYGDDCSCDYDCKHGTCDNGACVCTDGYQLPDCSCTLNQCSGHGTCLAEGCDCEEGWVNYECSGHGTCKNDDCSIFECHEQFKGEMCHVYKSDTEEGCKQLEHFIVNGPHYRENGVCDVDQYKSTWMSREYNLNPLQSVKLEATSDTDCYKKCMRGEGVNANIKDESRVIRPIKFSDNYGWKSVTPDWVKNEHIYSLYHATVKWGDNPIIAEWSDFAGMYYYYDTSSLTWTDREEFWTGNYGSVNSQSWNWHSNSFSISAPDCTTKEYSSETRSYKSSDSTVFYKTKSYTYKIHRTFCTFTLKVEPVSERIWAPFHGKICDATHLINPDKTVDDNRDYENVGFSGSRLPPPKFDRLCLPDEGIPPYPKYYPRMKDFFVKYDSTHYSYNNGECTCFGLSEDTCGTSQIISYKPGRSEWDNLVKHLELTRSMPVRRKSTRAYWKKNGDYCIKCPADHHAVPKENPTHCCPIGFEGNDCDTNINNCDPEPCITERQFCVDDKDQEEHGQFMFIDTYKCLCKDGYIGQEVNGVNPCDETCCVRGATVDRKFAGDLTVHGSCVMPDDDNPGGCKCDYGYEGYHCECTDSLCVNGYCKDNGDYMCSCHPGWNVDEDPDSEDYGKCTIGDNKCEPDDPCVNGICTNHFNDYHCKCPVGFIGKNCSVSTGWGDSPVSSCDDGKYLLQGRCVDCPHGTYSRGTTDTRCRIILTDDNIHDAVDSALNDPSDLYGDIKTFDTSGVTNMDRLFKNKTVPDISGWDVSSVTSMREMFMQAKDDPITSSWTFHQDVDKFWWKKGDAVHCPSFIGTVVNGRCRFTNSGLRYTVSTWINDESGTKNLYGPLSTWDVSYVTNMTDLFGTTTQNPDIRDWDMSHVVHADRMLRNTTFDYPIDNKDLSSLNTAEHMMPVSYSGRLCGKHFLRAGKEKGTTGFEEYGKCLTSGVIDGITVIKKAVNDWFEGDREQVIQDYGDMSEWDVSEVENMVGLFKGKTDIPSLKKWDVSGVTTMVSMFEDSNFNEDIRHWNVRAVDDFSFMFKNNKEFAVDLTFWEIHASNNEQIFYGNDHYDDLIFDVDSVVPEQMTDATFREALGQYFDGNLNTTRFGEISDWQTYLVTDMSGAFKGKDFNEDISSWGVGAVTDMSSMFEGSTFNRELNVWNVNFVQNMASMFKDNKHFNQMIDQWNVSSVTDMSSMFENSEFSRPIGSWDLYGTYWDETKKPNDGTYKCFKEEGRIVDLSDYDRTFGSAFRKCFDECSGSYPIRLEDIEGRNRDRTGGQVGLHYTPYMAGFGMIEDGKCTHTCQCATEIEDCEEDQITGNPCLDFERVMEYRDMNTTNMFKDNTKFIQPLCGIGWRYRDISSLNLTQRGVSLTCDICNSGEHMSTCGLCMGEFRFDHCLDSPYAFTMEELGKENPALLIGGDGNPLTSVDEIDEHTKVNPFACNCEYEEGLKGCLVVNGRKQVRVKEWYVDGETDFSHKINTNTQYYCELDFLDNRKVANAVGFNSVECTEDTLLDRIECGLVGGNWNGQCDKCLKPCNPPELGVKFISVGRECKECPEGETVVDNKCVKCPSGKFTDENYAFCGKCPQGTYGEDGDCYTCDSGHASTFQGALQCNMCNAGTYSVGTSCETCLAGTDSNNAADFCFEIAFCRHGATNTSKGTEAGNFCQSCNKGFKLEGETCVADCVHGSFTIEQCGENECGKCTCEGMWGGDNCNYCDTSKYIKSGDQCHETACDNSGPFTDCVCGTNPVTNGNLCYDGKPESLCSGNDNECLCYLGSTYEYTSLDYKCINQQVVRVCKSNELPHSTDFEGGSCALDGEIVDLSTHAVLNSEDVQICGGTVRTNCYAHPGFPVGFNCHSAECEDHQALNTTTLYNGMGGETSEICCQDRETCTSRECSPPMFGQYVVVRNETGICGQGGDYGPDATFYNTVEEASDVCTTMAKMGDRYVCTQGANSHRAPIVHSEECDSWVESIQYWNGTRHPFTSNPILTTFHPYTLSFMKTSIDISAYSYGLTFVDDEFKNRCCVETCEGRHADHGCDRPIYGFCEGECDASEFVSSGDEPSTCCEADKWYCNHGSQTCSEGYVKNSASCGKICPSEHFSTSESLITVNVEVINRTQVECTGVEQSATTIDECYEACDGFFQMEESRCYCVDDAPCKSQAVADCSDWCPFGLVRKDLSSSQRNLGTQTVCENNNLGDQECPPGWRFWLDSNDCYFVSSATHEHKDPETCFDNSNCCARLTSTYEQVNITAYDTPSFCCDSDPSKSIEKHCLSKQCPHRYTSNDNDYYTTNHTTECCNVVPESYFCDTFTCNSGKLFYTKNHCDGECTEEKCCEPDDHFCDSVPCTGDEVEIGLDYCGKKCEHSQCCKGPPICDRSFDCGTIHSSYVLDYNYICTDLIYGECAPSEYTLDKCCVGSWSQISCKNHDLWNMEEEGLVTVTGISPSWETGKVGNPMPGCKQKEGYLSYYKYGVLIANTVGSYTDEMFERECCGYVQTCPDDGICNSGVRLSTYAGTSLNRMCGGATSYLTWARVQNCTDYQASCCGIPWTCGDKASQYPVQCTSYECYSNGVGYKIDYVDADRYHQNYYHRISSMELQYTDPIVNKDDYMQKCRCPSNEEGCLEDEMKRQSTCAFKSEMDGSQCSEGLVQASWWSTQTHTKSLMEEDGFDSVCCQQSCESASDSYTCPSNLISASLLEGDHWTKGQSAITDQADFESKCCLEDICGAFANFYGDCSTVFPGTQMYYSSNTVSSPYDVSSYAACCSMWYTCDPFVQNGQRCPPGSVYMTDRIYGDVTEDNFESQCCKKRCSDMMSSCPEGFYTSTLFYRSRGLDESFDVNTCCSDKWNCGNVYTEKNLFWKYPVDGIEYQRSREFDWGYHYEYLEFNTPYVDQYDFAKKCFCPTSDPDCHNNEFLNLGLVINCEGVANILKMTCEEGNNLAGRDEFGSNIDTYLTKLFAPLPDWYVSTSTTDGINLSKKNFFMQECCANGENWSYSYALGAEIEGITN